MPTALRASFLTLGLAAALITGCDKASSTPAGGAASASDKLVGVWESVEEAKKDEPKKDDAKKDGPDDKATVEFKKDGGLSIAMGPFEMTGTWKVAKDEGKTVTIDTEVTVKGFGEGKSDKKSFKITFDDDSTMTMTPTDKNDPKKFKKKT
jgi:hypothetical protein